MRTIGRVGMVCAGALLVVLAANAEARRRDPEEMARPRVRDTGHIIVRVDKSPVFNGPSYDYALIARVDEGTVYPLVGHTGSWFCFLRGDDRRGWIHKDYVDRYNYPKVFLEYEPPPDWVPPSRGWVPPLGWVPPPNWKRRQPGWVPPPNWKPSWWGLWFGVTVTPPPRPAPPPPEKAPPQPQWKVTPQPPRDVTPPPQPPAPRKAPLPRGEEPSPSLPPRPGRP